MTQLALLLALRPVHASPARFDAADGPAFESLVVELMADAVDIIGTDDPHHADAHVEVRFHLGVVDFAQRLKKHGRKSGRSWGTLIKTPLITSCRKFDQFGDWYLFRNPGFVRKVFRGDDRTAADRFWYDVRSD